MFAEVVERFKNTGLQDSPPTHYDGPGHTDRETCTSKNFKMCEDLCCRAHLRYRNNDYPREKHTVIVVSGEPKGNICSCHNRLLEFNCQTDQRFICPPCLNEAHHGHETFSMAPQKTKTLECSIDIDTEADKPGARMLKEGMKHTGVKVVDTEVIRMGTVMVLDTERDDWESWS
ncbi:hypothetical protein QQF64_024579 [Cirrhinus molitorella]|uniref:B box-type domain-containing protein n=1 Tax=Cirrhinus molitorella TaxID=172907 RepID=A0ABR3NM84_9TELE